MIEYLATGTVTPWGVVEDMTFTAYRMTSGEFVPFITVHGRPKAVTPLVAFG